MEGLNGFLNFDCGYSGRSGVTPEQFERYELERIAKGFDSTETWNLDNSFCSYLEYSVPFVSGSVHQIVDLIVKYQFDDKFYYQLKKNELNKLINSVIFELKNGFIPSLNHTYLQDACLYLESRLPAFLVTYKYGARTSKFRIGKKTNRKQMNKKVAIKRIIKRIKSAKLRNHNQLQYEKAMKEFLYHLNSFWT